MSQSEKHTNDIVKTRVECFFFKFLTKRLSYSKWHCLLSNIAKLHCMSIRSVAQVDMGPPGHALKIVEIKFLN